MADKKVKVQVDVDTQPAENKLEGLGASIRRAKKELRNLPEGSQEWKNKFNEIDDLQDKLKAAEASSKDLFDTLESAPGPLGKLGAGLNSVKVATQSLGAAWKALGIGVVVSAIGGLVAAFANVEGAGKKLEPLLIGFEKILGGIFEALTPLIDSFVELATKALPYITNGVKVFYSSLVALFTLVKEGGAGIGKILKGIFTLDTKEIEAGFNQLKGSWSKTVDSYNETSKRFEEGTKKLTKTQKENLKEQNEAAKKALEEKIKLLEAENKLDEAQLNKLKEEALANQKLEESKLLALTESEGERLKIKEDSEQKVLDIEKRFAKLAYDAKIKDIEEKQKLYKKDSAEYKSLQAEKTQAEADYLAKTVEFADKQTTIDENNLKARKEFEEKAKEIRDAAIKDETEKALAQRQSKYDKDLADLEADKEFIKKSETEKAELRKALQQGLENDLDKIKTDARAKELDSQLKLDEARLKVLQENSAAYFDQQRVLENDAYESQKLKAKDNATELEAIETQHKANLKSIDESEFQAKKDLQLQIVNLYGGFGKALQELAGKNKGLAIAGLLIEQAAGVASIIINTQKAAAKAGYLTPLGIATIVAGVASVAAAIAATVKGIQQINAVNVPGGGSGGGAMAASANIAPPQVATTTAPQIQTQSEINPSTQIAQTINRTQEPIKAYVVSGEISSQQALDRRTSRAATFTGG